MLLEKHIVFATAKCRFHRQFDIKSPDLNLIEQLWNNLFLHTRLKFSLILPICTNPSERGKKRTAARRERNDVIVMLV